MKRSMAMRYDGRKSALDATARKLEVRSLKLRRSGNGQDDRRACVRRDDAGLRGLAHLFRAGLLLRRSPRWKTCRSRRVMVHGEKAAAYMADGYARASGKPGRLHGADDRRVQSRRGPARRATWRRADRRDHAAGRTPQLALPPRLSGSRGLRAVRRGHQVQRLRSTASRACPTSPPGFSRRHVRRAGPGSPADPGPPGQITEQEAELERARREAVSPQCRRSGPSRRCTHVQAALERPRQGAERPLIVAGGGVVTSGAQAELVELAEKLQIPVATSLNAKAAHPRLASAVRRRLRHLFARLRQPHAGRGRSRLLRRQPRRRPGHATLDFPPPGTTVIQLDIDPERARPQLSERGLDHSATRR